MQRYDTGVQTYTYIHTYLVRFGLGVVAGVELRREGHAGVPEKTDDFHRTVVAESSLLRVTLTNQSLQITYICTNIGVV